MARLPATQLRASFQRISSSAGAGWFPRRISTSSNSRKAARVDGTVVVQARQTLDESNWLLYLADQSKIIAGVAGWVPLIDPEVRSDLSRLASSPGIRSSKVSGTSSRASQTAISCATTSTADWLCFPTSISVTIFYFSNGSFPLPANSSIASQTSASSSITSRSRRSATEKSIPREKPA